MESVHKYMKQACVTACVHDGGAFQGLKPPTLLLVILARYDQLTAAIELRTLHANAVRVTHGFHFGDACTTQWDATLRKATQCESGWSTGVENQSQRTHLGSAVKPRRRNLGFIVVQKEPIADHECAAQPAVCVRPATMGDHAFTRLRRETRGNLQKTVRC